MANNTIALLAKPAEIDPLEPVQRAATLRQLALQQQTQDLAMRDELSARSALAQDPTGGDNYLRSLAGAGNVKGFYAAQKANLDAQNTRSDIAKNNATAEKTQLEALNMRSQRYRDALGNISDRAGAAQWVQAMYQDPQLGPIIQKELGPVDAALARIPDPAQDPQGFANWKRGSQLGAEKLVELSKPALGTLQLGNRVATTATNPFTGVPTVTSTQQMGQSPDNAATNATTRRGQDINAQTAKEGQRVQLQVAGMNADGTPAGDVEAMAQAIAAGKLAPIQGFALARPRGQAIMARVTEINPNYDAGDYAAKNAALKGFATGKEGTALRSFNVAIDHLDTLGQMADALKNGDAPALNRVANFFAQQTGQAAPTNFQAVKEIVAKEVVKAIVAGGGGVAEREEISNLMNKANSPEQLRGVIDHFAELMSAQKAGLLDQYQRTTGRTDGEQQFAARRHGGRAGASGTVPNTNARGWALHVDANGNKAYVSPDGRQFEEVK